MFGKNLKITEKLTISAAVFMIPIIIMLITIINSSFTEIRRYENELKGIAVLRPVISLMQVIPQYIYLSNDNASGDSDLTKQYAQTTLSHFIDLYQKNYSKDTTVVSLNSLMENWEHVSNGKMPVLILWAYKQLIVDLNKLIIYISETSGLALDSELESSYLVSAAIHEVPQAQVRMISIGNLLRTVIHGSFTLLRKSELARELDLLIYSDNARIQERFNASKNLGINSGGSMGELELQLEICHNNIGNFSNSVENFLNDQITDPQRIPVLVESAINANNSAFRLQRASLDRLEKIISERIRSRYLLFTLYILAAGISALASFLIVFFTIHGIRKSTTEMEAVFKSLDENDLTANAQVLSSDELGNFISALNIFLQKLRLAFASFNQNVSMVSNSMYELSSSSKEISATANEQSTSVSEIVSTLENNKNLSSQAAEKTVVVSQLAIRTQELSRRGAELRDFNEQMMQNIRNQNTKITDIIKNLADILSRIDESIQMIDSIADNTKLIAFNAALEASSSGEAGLRFSVVAGEIRRFADNVVESVDEIKEKITNLQDASGKLITEADYGSMVIDEGYHKMVEQKEVFENIVEASQNVAISTQQITNLSKQQEMASVQVFTALKEISAGINQFVTAIKTTSQTAERLDKMSGELKGILSKYKIQDTGV
ncbi:MAG: methyl-accepting chemotaxis protein [Treponema sp.]|jgi:methyl-accepting chemotaxis protein|nr:methyl-accepting chemotaxis protein [Treponema sp.]